MRQTFKFTVALSVAVLLTLTGVTSAGNHKSEASSKAGQVSISHQPDEDQIRVKLDGELFTKYIYEGNPHPILYPVHGPHGVRMNRHYPLKKGVDGESSDHPHQRSLMYGHGKINGHSFWNNMDNHVVLDEVLKASGNTIKTRNKWMADGEVQCTDTRRITFRDVPGGRAIDYEITLHASEGGLTIGDTKEGTMAMRMHPNLRIDRGAYAANSNGTTGKPIWGEAAKWVYYADKIDGRNVGVAILDHPGNPRHPSTWHAREYGLATANPFGYKFFLGDDHNGKMKIHPGGDVTFSYRFLFIEGKGKSADIGKRWDRFAASYTPDYVPEGYKLQYSQHFNDPASIDDFVFSSPGDWKRVKDGSRYAIEQNKDGNSYDPPVRSPRNIGLIKNLKVGSFVLDYDVKQIGRDYGHADACVFYNFVDPANYYYTHIGESRDNHAHQTFIVDDSPRTAITANQKRGDGHDWDDSWHHVRVVRDVEKGTIKVYINDMEEPAMRASDKTHKMGYIGFGSFDDQARFKNISVYAPKASREPAEFFEGK
jgi:hypothetical protein